jgi:lipopolysaccharide export system permease protein
LQTVWLFIAELAGKDLDFASVIKFLLFATPRVVPLVLPLSVLLASIMTFGSLAENYEFAAMKSAGFSLKRAMNSLIVFIGVLSVVAFLFANNVIPYAEFKFINFRRNIAQVKPAMAIAEGQFSDVGNYTIKVEKKSGDEGRFLDKVTIHKKANLGFGSNAIIKADKGEIVSSKNSNILKLVLKNGNYYEDIIPAKLEERNKIPFAKSAFKQYVINIDLSKFNTTNLDDEEITNTNTMLTVSELKYTLDSLSNNYHKDITSFTENINDRTTYANSNYGSGNFVPVHDTANSQQVLKNEIIISNFSDFEKEKIYKAALGTIDGINFALDSSLYEFENKQKNINAHWIALYDKFVIGFSCILMFFIGAPLGSIIRKGGLGLPIVFAVLIFIIYHFINTFGKKLAQEDGITPFLGAWMATLILLPFAIILTKRATDDKGIMSINLFPFIDWIEKLFSKKEATLLLDAPIPIPNSTLKIIEQQPSATTSAKITATDTVQKVSASAMAANLKEYHIFSNLALFSNLLIIFATIFVPQNKYLIISLVLSFLACFVFAQLRLKRIYSIQAAKIPINLYTQLLASVPFYFIFYIYSRMALKKLLVD